MLYLQMIDTQFHQPSTTTFASTTLSLTVTAHQVRSKCVALRSQTWPSFERSAVAFMSAQRLLATVVSFRTLALASSSDTPAP